MRRLSNIVQDWVSDLDAVSGKNFSVWTQSDTTLRELPRDILAVNADILFGGFSKALEYCVGKPLYHAENLILGKNADKPVFMYSK